MADNEQNYVTYGELILDMFLAGHDKVISSIITLTAKTIVAGGDVYDYTIASGEPSPKVGDIINQGGIIDCVIQVLTSPDQIKVETSPSPLLLNDADLLHSDKVPKPFGEELIEEAMLLIDEQTGQYFNKRTGEFKVEGNNTTLMHLPVPIIEILELFINSTETVLTEGEDGDFFAFKGRLNPQDDRKNPRIKLNIGSGRGSIFSGSLTARAFIKGTLTTINGSFGYLEPDGSTPAPIKRAVKILVMKEINEPTTASNSTTSGTGPLKRLKVDLHEQEFFEPSQNKDSSRSSSTGDATVDRIIARYRTPIRIKGSFKIRRANEDDFIRSGQII